MISVFRPEHPTLCSPRKRELASPFFSFMWESLEDSWYTHSCTPTQEGTGLPVTPDL